MTTTQTTPLSSIIHKAKEVPEPVYFLALINLILFVGLVCQEATIFYLIGLFAFTTVSAAFVGQISGLYQVPVSIISENVQTRVKELTQHVTDYAKQLHTEGQESKSINTIISILLVLYVSSFLNSTLEIFIIFNIAYALIFLPNEFNQVSQQAQAIVGNYINKVKATE